MTVYHWIKIITKYGGKYPDKYSDWTVGERTDGDYPWQVVGSDEIYAANKIHVGPAITMPEELKGDHEHPVGAA